MFPTELTTGQVCANMLGESEPPEEVACPPRVCDWEHGKDCAGHTNGPSPLYPVSDSTRGSEEGAAIPTNGKDTTACVEAEGDGSCSRGL